MTMYCPEGVYEYSAQFVVPPGAPKQAVREWVKAAQAGMGKRAAKNGHIIFMMVSCRKKATDFGKIYMMLFLGATPEAVAAWAPTIEERRKRALIVRMRLRQVRRGAIQRCGTLIANTWFTQRSAAEEWWRVISSSQQSPPTLSWSRPQ